MYEVHGGGVTWGCHIPGGHMKAYDLQQSNNRPCLFMIALQTAIKPGERLLSAARHGQLEVILQLLRANPALNVNTRNVVSLLH